MLFDFFTNLKNQQKHYPFFIKTYIGFWMAFFINYFIKAHHSKSRERQNFKSIQSLKGHNTIFGKNTTVCLLKIKKLLTIKTGFLLECLSVLIKISICCYCVFQILFAQLFVYVLQSIMHLNLNKSCYDMYGKLNVRQNVNFVKFLGVKICHTRKINLKIV